MTITRKLTGAAFVAGIFLFTACERFPAASVPRVAPSPATSTTAAAAIVGAPADDVRRASAGLAEHVPGWNQPQVVGPGRASPQTDAAALRAASPADLAAATAALESFLREASSPAQATPE